MSNMLKKYVVRDEIMAQDEGDESCLIGSFHSVGRAEWVADAVSRISAGEIYVNEILDGVEVPFSCWVRGFPTLEGFTSDATLEGFGGAA